MFEKNIALNSLTNVKVYKVALSDKNDVARLYRHPYPTMHSLGLGQGNLSNDFEEVPVRMLDDVLAEEGITQVDFLKVDTEGADELVLRGGRR